MYHKIISKSADKALTTIANPATKVNLLSCACPTGCKGLGQSPIESEVMANSLPQTII